MWYGLYDWIASRAGTTSEDTHHESTTHYAKWRPHC